MRFRRHLLLVLLLVLCSAVGLVAARAADTGSSGADVSAAVSAVHDARLKVESADTLNKWKDALAQLAAADDGLQAAWAAYVPPVSTVTEPATTTTDTTPPPPTTTDTTTTTETTPTTTTTETVPPPPPATADVDLVDQTWKCPGAVNLGTVRVKITSAASATDGVLLKNGCTGYIDRIEVEQWKGDGIHITNAHDLVIGSVLIRCYAHSPLKHQDGIQVLGGQRVTVNNADVGCYSANNSQVWINDGAGGSGPGGVPTDVLFVGGVFQGLYNAGEYGPGGSYGVSIGDSIRTGFRNVKVCPNAHTARQVNVTGSAVDPVLDNVDKAASC